MFPVVSKHSTRVYYASIVVRVIAPPLLAHAYRPLRRSIIANALPSQRWVGQNEGAVAYGSYSGCNIFWDWIKYD